MNRNLRNLVRIAEKPERLAIGLMSGTSLDGLDIALCRFRGHGFDTRFELLEFHTVPYSTQLHQELQQVFSKRTVDLQEVTVLNARTGAFFAELVLSALSEWGLAPSEADFIASHGQTIYHAPRRLHGQPDFPDATLQIGDGDHLAVHTGILTISDFRQKHIAAGGEGAPLALYGDVLLAASREENRILLNIGGIANLTFVPADAREGKVLCSDIGPGNTLIDLACRLYFNKPFDRDAEIAWSGTVNEALLAELLRCHFFQDPAPKTTGPELFDAGFFRQAREASGTAGISERDLVTTLTAFTARAAADFILDNFPGGTRILLSGGGAKNSYLTNALKTLLPEAEIGLTSAVGIDPDAKEAILFALLGNEALCGEPLDLGSGPAVLMGKFSFPL